MMLFLHLFNQLEQVALCHTVIDFWNGKPIVYALSRIGGFCVPIYLFLSGYGLSSLYEKNKGKMHYARRIFKLYVNYWIVILLFIPLGAYIAPEKYPGDIVTFMQNFIAWKYTYNHEWWFLFPYILLVITSPFIFRFLWRLNSFTKIWSVILGLTVIYFAVYFADKQWRFLLDSCYPLYQLKQYIYCLYSFVLGAIFQRHAFFEYCRQYIQKKMYSKRILYLNIGLLMLCVLRMMLGPSIINPFFVILFLIIYNSFTPHRVIRSFLRFMGSHATNMWLVHTFFAYYLFYDFIYGLKYPLLMYVTLIVLSLISSYLIRFIYYLLHLNK